MDPVIEVFNLFNRRNCAPANYNINLTSPNFGRPGRSAMLKYRPLQVQLGVRMAV